MKTEAKWSNFKINSQLYMGELKWYLFAFHMRNERFPETGSSKL